MNGRAPKAKRAPEFVGHSIPLAAPKTSATAEAGSKKRHSYKPLPTQFRRDGFDYRQVARERNAAIYQQTSSGCQNPSACYEVIRIRRREGFEIEGARHRYDGDGERTVDVGDEGLEDAGGGDAQGLGGFEAVGLGAGVVGVLVHGVRDLLPGEQQGRRGSSASHGIRRYKPRSRAADRITAA